MSTADKLNKLLETKQAIKQAIINKGIDVADDTKFADYPSKISSIEDRYQEGYDCGSNDGYSNGWSDGWNQGYYEGGNGEGGGDPYYEDFYNLRTNNGTNMSGLFSYYKEPELDLRNLDVSKVTDMSYMFYDGEFKKIDLTGWNTSHVTNMNSMFSKYNNPLEELIIPDWDMSNCNDNIFYRDSYIPKLKLIDLSRSNDATITKIASFLPTRTTTTFGTVLVPYDMSQEAYDALVAKYWRPIGAAMTPIPTSCSIVAELDEIMPGKSTKVYLGSYEPWNADPSKVELVLVSDSSIATMTEDNEVISTGVLGDIVLEVRIKDTQEVISTKTIVVSEIDSYPNLVKFRIASAPSSYTTIVTVNGSGKRLSDLTYDSFTDIYSYDAGVPITSIRFNQYSNISELVKLNISNVTNMSNMFSRCESLTSLDVSNWDTSNVTNMGIIFYGCKSLITLDASNFDTRKVTDMQQMFGSCTALEELDLSNFDIINASSTYAHNMFYDCTSLQVLRLDNCSNDTINKIITSVGFPTNAIEGVTRTIYCKEENAAGLTPPTNWVFSYVTEEEPEVPVDPPAGDIPLYEPGEFRSNTEITEVVTVVDESHTDLSYMFYECNNLTSVNTQDWDVSNVTTVNCMFSQIYGSNLATLDFSNWDTSNMTIMDSMFAYMQSNNLPKLDLSSFNTKKLQQAYYMFNWCNMLQELDIRNFELVHEDGTEAAISGMLEGCVSLHTLRLDNCSNATIRKIINESGMPQEPIYDYSISENINRKMYCKASEIGDLVAPNGWEFVTVE